MAFKDNLNALLETHNLTLEPYDSRRLANLCGQLDEHLHQIQDYFEVEIRNRGNLFQLTGPSKAVHTCIDLINFLYSETASGKMMTPDFVHLCLREASNSETNHSAINQTSSEQRC